MLGVGGGGGMSATDRQGMQVHGRGGWKMVVVVVVSSQPGRGRPGEG